MAISQQSALFLRDSVKKTNVTAVAASWLMALTTGSIKSEDSEAAIGDVWAEHCERAVLGLSRRRAIGSQD
jgi:hypothetical protein